MEYVYAALMLHKLKKDINEDNITSLVKASGAEVNPAQVKALVASLADVNIEEAIKAAPVAVAAAPAAAGGEAAAGGGEKKEGKKEKAKADGKSEEQAMEGLSALFG
jgi:large subunit ribosomal protein L12